MNEAKQFLYSIKPTRLAMLTDGATKAEETTLSQHFNYLQDLTQKGTVIMAGRTQTADINTFGIVIFKAENEAEAREIMLADPAVAQGVMAASLYPFRIALPLQAD